MSAAAIPRPVLMEAVRLLTWYASDESNPDEDTVTMLTSFSIQPALDVAERPGIEAVVARAGEEDCFVISCASVDFEGPVAEPVGEHDDWEVLTGGGALLSHVSDGVERVGKMPLQRFENPAPESPDYRELEEPYLTLRGVEGGGYTRIDCRFPVLGTAPLRTSLEWYAGPDFTLDGAFSEDPFVRDAASRLLDASADLMQALDKRQRERSTA